MTFIDKINDVVIVDNFENIGLFYRTNWKGEAFKLDVLQIKTILTGVL